jgi:hypothetical protein
MHYRPTRENPNLRTKQRPESDTSDLPVIEARYVQLDIGQTYKASSFDRFMEELGGAALMFVVSLIVLAGMTLAAFTAPIVMVPIGLVTVGLGGLKVRDAYKTVSEQNKVNQTNQKRADNAQRVENDLQADKPLPDPDLSQESRSGIEPLRSEGPPLLATHVSSAEGGDHQPVVQALASVEAGATSGQEASEANSPASKEEATPHAEKERDAPSP